MLLLYDMILKRQRREKGVSRMSMTVLYDHLPIGIFQQQPQKMPALTRAQLRSRRSERFVFASSYIDRSRFRLARHAGRQQYATIAHSSEKKLLPAPARLLRDWYCSNTGRSRKKRKILERSLNIQRGFPSTYGQ